MALEDDIDQAVMNTADPWKVNDLVHAKPIVNTAHEKPDWHFVSFAPDPDHPAAFAQPEKYRYVAYWKLADKKEYTSIIGIVWDENMRSKKFYAVVLAPE